MVLEWEENYLTLYQTTKFWTWTKLKAIADDKIKVIQKSKFLLGRVENTVGIEENAGSKHFLLFQQCFQKLSTSGSLKVRTVY